MKTLPVTLDGLLMDWKTWGRIHLALENIISNREHGDF